MLVQLYSEKIRIYDASHKKVAEHERNYSKGSWTLDINHYIGTLIKKPGALKGGSCPEADAREDAGTLSCAFCRQLKGFPQTAQILQG